MCSDEICRAHSLLTSMAIRLAECMGFHRDPSEFGFSPLECQVRRLIWYQICYLDLKTSEVQGPRPYIHHDGYTTQIPTPAITSTWNDMVFSMIRFECQEMQRKCLVLRTRVDQKKISLTKAIAKIEAFRVRMDAKYGPLLDTATPSPMQKMARQVMKLFTNLLYLISLHRYMNSVTYRVPDRLRQIVLSKGTEALEAAMELEVSDDLKQWSWYSSAYQQYHSAFLLLVEVFTFPLRREANRIWRCLDFIFADVLRDMPALDTNRKASTPQDLITQRDVKARFLLTMICDNMRAYQKSRGLKDPSHFQDSMIILTPQKHGDTSDPRMPLNYAHGEPDTRDPPQQHPSISQNPQFPHQMTTESENIPSFYIENTGAEAFHIPQNLGNTRREWTSSYDHLPSLPQNYESQFNGATDTMYPQTLHPDYLAPSSGWTSNERSTYSDDGEIQSEVAAIDPQMLEIDWVSSFIPNTFKLLRGGILIEYEESLGHYFPTWEQ